MFITDEMIDRLIKEDVPYFDLTTYVLDIGRRKGKIRYTSRQSAVISGTEIVGRVFAKLGIDAVNLLPSGTRVEAGDVLAEGDGNTESLHMAWKVGMNILEYCSGIATRTSKLVQAVKKIDPKIEIVTTRKIFPGTKELSIKAALDGGALPHRLGLSETILVFKQHAVFLGGIKGFLSQLEEIKLKAREKKITVEVECREDAIELCKAGIDALQFDKVPPEELKEIIADIRKINPGITLIATGGINADNIEKYASAGIDTVNTSWVYYGKPVDLGAEITGTDANGQ
ncbi:modD protein [Syntrophobotulus glycolicus DSM 8271]|uniref:Putative pyrophosphorylase ModD n=1 Tax=Syntrophobotulus glycolicus (strain DSM 8271 / FlGlyR) TaxID=645991 RepID=F0SWG1_SYNGF|nr:ModD protein [Syntrophobotulus glycolicus]ADY55727.1 modD protein [Syntrophobotulus glycolicus DSM 8271]